MKYSITYSIQPSDGTICTVDWDGRKWLRAFLEPGSTSWYFEEGLSELSYNALIEHFGLERWAGDEYPQEKVEYMGPAKLCRERREKERIHGLSLREMVNEQVGNPCHAEDCE